MPDDDAEEIDDEQVEDYCSMLDKLGTVPEKIKINSLSMAAEDFASSHKSATTIYKCILSRLIDTKMTPGGGISSPNRKLPLVYVLDSLLKNVGGVYIDIIQDDAANWMRIVYDIFDINKKEDEKARLKKVWNTWKEFGVIKDIDKWREIGQCFLEAEEKAKAAAVVAASSSSSTNGGGGAVLFERNADGTLKISSSLRKQMQLLLDEVQSTGVDELDKVSLERLADINPDLLQQIKDAAMEEQKQQQQQQQSNSSSTSSRGGIKSSSVSSINPPISSSSSSSDWSKLKLNHLEKSSSLIASLQRHVRSANGITILSSQIDDTVHLYASVSASAQILTTMLQQLKDGTSSLLGMDEEDDDEKRSKRKRRYSIVKKENFTNDGVRKRNDAVISQLYEVGLPFICSTDGRRFASQLELSKHLDALFRISQVEKNIERTGGIGGNNERGWYINEDDWSGMGKTTDDATMTGGTPTIEKTSTTPMSTINDEGTIRPTTVIADESRDRCSLCGINFAMFFDQDDGEWKYRNCIESNVENDGPTMEEEDCEPVLVHITCWEGLGCPAVLSLDDIRHST